MAEMNNLSPYSVVAVAALLLAAPAVALFIDVQFIGGVDIAAFSTWNWAKGSPLPNQEVERATRATIVELMALKGYTKVEGEADCYIAIHAEADEWFDGGLFKVEALDGKTSKTVWRGKAEGAVNVQSTGKRQKLAVRTVKKMFKKFPDKRVE